MASPALGDVPVDDRRCFVCGPDNPIGLRLRFEPSGERSVTARVTLEGHFQGWKGVAHGGIAMALLDDAMAHAAASAGYRGVTGSMATRFRKPVPVGELLTVTGIVASIRRQVLFITAQLRDNQAQLLAEAQGNFVAKGRIDASEIR